MSASVSANVPFDRPRLIERFADAAAHPVTIVLAPAGCGKTVALGQYLATLERPAHRYDVRREHAHLLGFVRGLADALHGIAPNARATVADAVASAMHSNSPAKPLALWMSNHLPLAHAVIAVDGFHYAEADADCVEFISELIERTKRYVRWIVASRTAQHLPVSSWTAYGDASRPIDEEDLRFTRGEGSRAAGSCRSSLSENDVLRLVQTTGGWATAFTLALRIAEYAPDLDSISTTTRQLSYEYLAEHVYNPLAVEERALLLVAAVLPDIDADILKCAGFSDAKAMLDRLQRRSAFLSAVPAANDPNEPIRYRCHDIFRDFLVHELEMQGARAGNGVRIRAAAALLAAGSISASLRLYANAGATGETLDILKSHGFELADSAHSDVVQIAIESLPEALRSGDPLIIGLYAQFEHAAGRFGQARSLFEHALAQSPSKQLAATLVAKLSGTLFNLASNPAPLLESIAYDRELSPVQRGTLLALLAVSYARFGQHEGLDELLDNVEALVNQIESNSTRATMLHQLGTAALIHGDSPRAIAALERAAELAIDSGMFRLASIIFTSLSSNAALNDGNLSTALQSAQRAGEAAIQSGQLNLVRYALARQIDVAVHRGDSDRVSALLRSYRELPGPEQPQLSKATYWARAMLAAWNGDFAEACRLQAEVRANQPFQEERMLAKAWYSLFALAAGRREEALASVQDAMQETKSRTSPRASFDRAKEAVRVLSALCEALAGRISNAERLLGRKHRFDSPVALATFNAVSAIVDGLRTQEPMDEILAAHAEDLREHWHGGYAVAFASLVRWHSSTRKANVQVTATELAIFRALSEGRTPKEIALETGSSINTVRWHIRRAVAKFGCSGQAQALRAMRIQGSL